MLFAAPHELHVAHITAPDVCDGTSAVGESRHSIPGASVGQPTEPCLGEQISARLCEPDEGAEGPGSRLRWILIICLNFVGERSGRKKAENSKGLNANETRCYVSQVGSSREEDKMREMSGGCLCGQARYSAHADPAMVAVPLQELPEAGRNGFRHRGGNSEIGDISPGAT